MYVTDEAIPSFLILGAQKAGTTALFEHLASHPAVVRPATKELQFFTLHFDRGLDWYRSQLRVEARTLERQWTFESSPYYLFHPDVPARCAACCPHTRLIILLRDPVARALSHYGHEVRLGYETLSLEAAFAAEPERLRLPLSTPDGLFAHRHGSYRARSRYAGQIEAWLAHFPAHRIKVIQSEILFAQPDQVGRAIREFLNLSDSAEQRPLERLNAGGPVEASAAFIAELQREFAGERERLAALLRTHWGQELRHDLW